MAALITPVDVNNQPLAATIDMTVSTLAAASTTVTSTDMINTGYRGVKIGVNITAMTGTVPTLTVTVQGKDVASGTYYTLLVSTAIAVTGFTVLEVYPAVVAASNLVAGITLPRVWRVVATPGGTTPAITGTIGASMIL
jgi:hypothetical protein